MEKVMNYFTGFFGGLITIMMHVIPVTILWTLLTGNIVFGMDVISNFIILVNDLGNAGFVGLVALMFIMYFFIDCKKDCSKK
jgi:hypothetical protein|tara:strand:- start:36 stop:281 length:246 start_codon:yes stop_codon:yes gene_type:complete